MFSRIARRLLARICIGVVLFAQLAIAGYACEMSPNQTASAASVHAGMPGCDKMNSSLPNLCQQHCQAGSQASELTPHYSPPVPSLVAVVAVIGHELTPPLVVMVPASLLARATAPPPQLRFSVFRI